MPVASTVTVRGSSSIWTDRRDRHAGGAASDHRASSGHPAARPGLRAVLEQPLSKVFSPANAALVFGVDRAPSGRSCPEGDECEAFLFWGERFLISRLQRVGRRGGFRCAFPVQPHALTKTSRDPRGLPASQGIPFEGYEGMTQQQFQEVSAPFTKHGGQAGHFELLTGGQWLIS